MQLRALIVAASLAAAPVFVRAQARPLVITSSPPVTLSAVPGDQVILGAVSLGQQRSFSIFNVQATGSITPDPALNGAAFQLQLLICDQLDCNGDVRSATRTLGGSDSDSSAQILATQSFGISTHNAAPVVLNAYKPRNPGGPLYLAVALRVLHSPEKTRFTGQLNLLRVDVMP
jgi:hypothetical protein